MDLIEVDGLALELTQSPFGPEPCFVNSAGPLDALRILLDGVIHGTDRRFIEEVEHGEITTTHSALARPAEPTDDLVAAGELWRELTGHELGTDVYMISVFWNARETAIPRRTLLELVRRLESLRATAPKPPGPWLFMLRAIHHDPHPDEEPILRSLEARALELDRLASQRGDLDHEATVAAKRRFLLAELETYGILTVKAGEHRAFWLERWALPTLLGYQRATLSIGNYWHSSSGVRYRRFSHDEMMPLIERPSVLGAAVSVDWFRFAVPTPAGWHVERKINSDDDDHDWLAFCERALVDANPAEGYSGELYVHHGAFRCVIAWRRDDGVHACVVSARLR